MGGDDRAHGAAILLLFATPLRALWARDDGPWWLPFALWAPMIVALARILRDRGPQ